LKEKEADLTRSREAKLKDIEDKLKKAKQIASELADNTRTVRRH